MTDDEERKTRITLKRIVQLQRENVLLTNAIQRAQWLIVEGKYDEADQVLRDVIHQLLETEAESIKR